VTLPKEVYGKAVNLPLPGVILIAFSQEAVLSVKSQLLLEKLIIIIIIIMIIIKTHSGY
jgi:hypothetical protein